MRNRSTVIAMLAVAVLIGDPSSGMAAAGGGGGGGGVGSGGSGSEHGRQKRSPEYAAESEYKRGLRKRDNAWNHEQKAEEATSDKSRAKENEKAAKDWQDAAKHFRKAIRHKANFHQAHSSLGYALRKQGNYPDSIAAYDRALAIDPKYAEAIEYRAEAYLAQNRIREATDSYMRLFALDREKAGMLMTAMEAWVHDAQKAPPAGVAPDTFEWFGGWVERRKEIATQIDVDVSNAGRW